MIILFRLYQLFIMLPIVIVATLLTSILTIVVCLFGHADKSSYYLAKWWGRIICWASLVKVTIKGREHIDSKTSYVFVANHQGAYDIFSIYGYLGHNFKWMMKKSLEKIPFVGYACRRAGQIFVDNSSPAAVRQTMADAHDRLQGGLSLVVFPEGTRAHNGKIRNFKKGAYQLAVEFNLPVVPITISGSYEIMPKGSKLTHWGHITLTIHEPIHAQEQGHDLAQVMEQSREAILSALPQRYK